MPEAMQERDGAMAFGLMLLLLLLPAGYYVHISPRFAGSFVGSMIGIAGAVLMLVPLLYLIVKRVPWLRTHVTRWMSLRTLLAVHIYAGILGPILGIIHSGHKFRSPLALSLVGLMIVVVLSGYAGRYLLGQITTAIQGRRSELAVLNAAFATAAAGPVQDIPAKSESNASVRAWLPLFFQRGRHRGDGAPTTARSIEIAEAMADVDFAIRIEELARDLFTIWLRLHIAIAMILYALLALHIWSGYYFGFRWLS